MSDEMFASGQGVGSSIWLGQRKLGETGLYLGIVCDTNQLVVAAYAAVIEGGGTDEGKLICHRGARKRVRVIFDRSSFHGQRFDLLASSRLLKKSANRAEFGERTERS